MTSQTNRLRLDRRGTALLSVMLLVFLLMIAIAGAFMRTATERRAALDGTAQVDAYTLAQNGIEKYLATVSAVPALPDSQTFTLTGGRAVVTLRALALSSSDSVLVLISRGENTTTNRYASTSATGSRTVAQLVRFSSSSLSLPGAFVSLVPVQKNGNSGALSGVDACTTSPQPSIPGVAVPSVSTTDPSADYSGHTSPIDGNPDNTPVAIGTPGPTGTAKDSVHIDWAGIVARTAITPTYYYKTTAPTSGSWPTNAQLSGSNWPITFVDGDLSLPSDGQGILIVTGNLTVNGSNHWHGLTLVGGTITSNGNNQFYGAVFVGLNVKLGIAVGSESVANGTKIFQYNSCDVTAAMSPFGGWTRLGNAWVDNFPIY